MDLGGPPFVIAIIALSIAAWLINNWIRARHGYALENEWGGMTEPTGSKASAELKRENAALRSELKTVHERVAVLERIVTDKGYGVAEQIEALRDQRRVDDADAGMSIESLKRERV